MLNALGSCHAGRVHCSTVHRPLTKGRVPASAASLARSARMICRPSSSAKANTRPHCQRWVSAGGAVWARLSRAKLGAATVDPGLASSSWSTPLSWIPLQSMAASTAAASTSTGPTSPRSACASSSGSAVGCSGRSSSGAVTRSSAAELAGTLFCVPGLGVLGTAALAGPCRKVAREGWVGVVSSVMAGQAEALAPFKHGARR